MRMKRQYDPVKHGPSNDPYYNWDAADWSKSLSVIAKQVGGASRERVRQMKEKMGIKTKGRKR